MYEQEQPASLSEIDAWIKDMTEKIAYIDNNFNHKDFKLVQGAKELELKNFLAKRILVNIRSTLVHEINELNREKNHILHKKS